MKYLGLDLGEKTLGVALSESGIIAHHLQTIRFYSQNFTAALEELLKIIKSYQIDIVVLGLPKHMNNDIGEKGLLAQQFKTMIEGASSVKVILWDERLSTRSALKYLSDNNKKYDKQRALKDEVAAQIILQNYLDSLGGFR